MHHSAQRADTCVGPVHAQKLHARKPDANHAKRGVSQVRAAIKIEIFHRVRCVAAFRISIGINKIFEVLHATICHHCARREVEGLKIWARQCNEAQPVVTERAALRHVERCQLCQVPSSNILEGLAREERRSRIDSLKSFDCSEDFLEVLRPQARAARQITLAQADGKRVASELAESIYTERIAEA